MSTKTGGKQTKMARLEQENAELRARVALLEQVVQRLLNPVPAMQPMPVPMPDPIVPFPPPGHDFFWQIPSTIIPNPYAPDAAPNTYPQIICTNNAGAATLPNGYGMLAQ